jgi:hypothetical protein
MFVPGLSAKALGVLSSGDKTRRAFDTGGHLMFSKLVAAAAFALSLSISAASAATVFNLGGASAVAGSFSTTVDGITVTATGERRDGVASCGFLCVTTFFQPENLSREANGLGVKGGGLNLDSPALDGQIDERMTFDFGKKVRLISISFSEFDSNDPYNVLVDMVQVATDSFGNPFLFAANTVGQLLRIDVTSNSSAFRVSSITVQAIPLPAGGLLLIGALGGLALLRKRRA